MESVNPAAPGEDIPEHFARLLRNADPGAYVSLDGRGDPGRTLAFDGWFQVEPLLQEFLRPYVEEAIKARPIQIEMPNVHPIDDETERQWREQLAMILADDDLSKRAVTIMPQDLKRLLDALDVARLGLRP